MSEILQVLQLIFSLLIVPILGYVIRVEKRLTKVETYVEIMFKNVHKRNGESS